MTTTTISPAQYEFATERVRATGLEHADHRARPRLPGPARHLRQSGRDRDDRSRGLARVRRVLRVPAPPAGRRRRAGDAGDRRARQELRSAQAPHRLHQGRDLPRRLPPLDRRAHGRREPQRPDPPQRRPHRPALRRDAATLARQPATRSRPNSRPSGSMLDSAGSGTSTSHTAKPDSTSATSAQRSCCTPHPASRTRHDTAAPARTQLDSIAV